MQLQKDRKQIEAAGVHVVGVSYDSVEVLGKFAESKGIEFPLLSDEGSKTITAYGILYQKGLPHPGTFVIDQDGVVRAKLFREGYRVRHTTAELIEAVRGLE